MIATVFLGAIGWYHTIRTRCSIKLPRLGHTHFLMSVRDSTLPPCFLTHVHHETTVCMSGVCVRVFATLSTLLERSLMARPLLGRSPGIELTAGRGRPVGSSASCKFRTPPMMESSLPGTAVNRLVDTCSTRRGFFFFLQDLFRLRVVLDSALPHSRVSTLVRPSLEVTSRAKSFSDIVLWITSFEPCAAPRVELKFCYTIAH